MSSATPIDDQTDLLAAGVVRSAAPTFPSNDPGWMMQWAITSLTHERARYEARLAFLREELERRDALMKAVQTQNAELKRANDELSARLSLLSMKECA